MAAILEERIRQAKSYLEDLIIKYEQDFSSKRADNILHLRLAIEERLDINVTGISPESDPEVGYLLGAAYNMSQDSYSAVAEQYLSKSVKLDPADWAAFWQLGLCFWRKGDLSSAKFSLLESVNIMANTAAYRELSILVRQLKSDKHGVEESIAFAKKAIKLDLNDHRSWYILGNALSANYFIVSKDVEDLKKALNAYQRSESMADDGGQRNPDLFFNRGNILRYLQDFSGAIHAYQKAAQVDASLAQSSSSNIARIKSFCRKCTETMTQAGKLSPLRLQECLTDLRTSPYSVNSIGFKDGISSSKSVKDGEESSIFAAKILFPINSAGESAEKSFLAIDSHGHFGVISFYDIDISSCPSLKQYCTVAMSAPSNRPSLDFDEIDRLCEANSITFPFSVIADGSSVASAPSSSLLQLSSASHTTGSTDAAVVDMFSINFDSVQKGEYPSESKPISVEAKRAYTENDKTAVDEPMTNNSASLVAIENFNRAIPVIHFYAGGSPSSDVVHTADQKTNSGTRAATQLIDSDSLKPENKQATYKQSHQLRTLRIDGNLVDPTVLAANLAKPLVDVKSHTF